MARYLTPAKIGLLVLIELYTESVVPTASTTSILSFVISHLLPSSLPKPQNHLPGPAQSEGENRQSFLIPIKDFEKLLSAHYSASGLPGRTLWDLFLKKLWDIDSLDALHVFFERRANLLAKKRDELKADTDLGIPPPSPDMILLSRTSPFGAFVRRSQLEFTRLKFQDALNLWKSFIVYRQVTLPQWRKRNANAGPWSFDAVLHKGDQIEEWGEHALETFTGVAYGTLLSNPEEVEGLVSTDDVEKLLEFQIEQMQSELNNTFHEISC
jgi:anaphase-promoting complex subunit 5